MSDDNREPAAGAPPAATETPAPAAPAKTIAEIGVPDAPPPAADPAPPADAPAEAPKADAPKPDAVPSSWPDDWRDKFAGGDEKLKQMLSRYASPDAVAKAFKEQRDALAKRPAEVPELPENPTEEQLAAYRKAKGVPAKPEDYEFEVPDGKQLSDTEYEILMDFAKNMHGANMPADQVKKISSWFLEYEGVVAQRNAEAAYKARVATEEKLRSEWGGDFKANINQMSNVLREHLGSNTDSFLSMQLMDGSKIGDNETFLRLMAEVSRKIGGSAADLYSSDVATTSQGLEARKAELLAMSVSPDPKVRKQYWSDPKIQDEMQRIQSALVRRAS